MSTLCSQWGERSKFGLKKEITVGEKNLSWLKKWHKDHPTQPHTTSAFISDRQGS